MIFREHLFNEKLPLYTRALDTYALRERTIAKNIANTSSPHYKPEMVKFEEFFNNQEIATTGAVTNEKHIAIGPPKNGDIRGELTGKPVPQPEIYFSGDSHVNIDKEMSDLAENQIRFRFASRLVKKFFSGINSAVSGFRE